VLLAEVSEGLEGGLRGGLRSTKPEVSPVHSFSLRVLISGAWRTSRTASGSFEGVLGFGGPAQPPVPTPAPAPPVTAAEPVERPQSPWKEKGEPKEKVGEVFGSGGGPGWGTGQKKWRIAAGLASAPENEKVCRMNLLIQDRANC